MTTELTILAWTLVLALVQVFLPITGKTRAYGTAWNAGPRDEARPDPDRVTARLDRAQRNLFETLPVFIAAVLIAHLAGREGQVTTIGAGLYLAGRIVYVPIYAMGVAYVRSLAWAVSFAGLVMILVRVLLP